jgi:hypothetical protein
MSIEAMKQALEALEWNCKGEPLPTLELKAITALRQAIEQAEKQEPVAWRSAAIRLGEELSSVGCDNYYNLTAEQWLDWALAQEPRGKNSLPTPRKEWVGLTDEEIAEGVKQSWVTEQVFQSAVWWAEAKLKEKNT